MPIMSQLYLMHIKNWLIPSEKELLKFKEFIQISYGALQLPCPDLIKKAKKYAKKYEIRDDVFDIFIKMVLSDKYLNTTNM